MSISELKRGGGVGGNVSLHVSIAHLDLSELHFMLKHFIEWPVLVGDVTSCLWLIE